MSKIIYLFLLFSISSSMLTAQHLTAMTYNIRYDNPQDSMNAWEHRKEFLRNQVQFYHPDVMGTQEGLKHQLDYLDTELKDYTYKGVARDDGKTKGEYTAIFYNTKKLNLLAEGTFWLSKTPDTCGLGWDAVCNRTCTYLLLENKTTDQKFWVFNTHFDHVGKVARANAAALILEKINQLNSPDHPLIFMGDLNIEPTDVVYSNIISTLSDTKNISQELPFGNEGTYNGFKFHQPLKRRIDYIFVNQQISKVVKYAVLSDSKDCRYPSDHLPVFVELIF